MEKMVPQSRAILDGAKRLVSLDLANDPRINPSLAGDSLQFDQWCPSYELRKLLYKNNHSLISPYSTSSIEPKRLDDKRG